MKQKAKIKPFDVVHVIIFIIISIFVLIPIYKVLVDSFDLRVSSGLRLFPQVFGLEGYKTVLTYPTIVHPFMISCLTTVVGTFLGLLISTLGGYTLIQYKMPGRTFIANFLLFKMIFNGGMIPTYLVIQGLHMTNTLWAVLLPQAVSVYNIVLMRNFFDGIPESLFEAAEIDGCTPLQSFFKIALPLSKAALASIGLMCAVGYWNDYTNYKLYITNSNLYNFQMKLRDLILGSDMPGTTEGVSDNTVRNAAVIVAIIPFMIIYPFCQKYFVQGVNIGAVKE